MVEWIRMPIGMEIGLGPGHIVSAGDPAPPKRGQNSPPIFGPCLLWANGWMDQDATWCGGRSRPRIHCVRWGPIAPPMERGTAPTHFSAHFALARSPISATAELLLTSRIIDISLLRIGSYQADDDNVRKDDGDGRDR